MPGQDRMWYLKNLHYFRIFSVELKIMPLGCKEKKNGVYLNAIKALLSDLLVIRKSGRK